MATPWCEFCAVEMLIFMVGLREGGASHAEAEDQAGGQWFNFMGTPVRECCKLDYASRMR